MTNQYDLDSTVKIEIPPLRPVASVLSEHPLFAELRPSQMCALTDNAMRMHYEPGALIFREGDPADRFYLIETGKVALQSYRKDKLAVNIQTIGYGGLLGWSWLFPPYYWRFDARVLEPTTAIFLYGVPIRQLCEKDHDLGYHLMKRVGAIVIRRLQGTRKELLTALADDEIETSADFQ